tara:strand:+ start:516 stop:845 length:330 start_codon:yes stop_codon:yes gene_type:complete
LPSVSENTESESTNQDSNEKSKRQAIINIQKVLSDKVGKTSFAQNKARETPVEETNVAIDANDSFDDDFEINPERGINMKGLSNSINPATGTVGNLVQTKDRSDEAISD